MSDGEDDDQDAPVRPAPAAALNGDLLTRKSFPASDRDFRGANDEALAIRLAVLEQEHRDLDAAITSLEMNSPYERLTIARLKKKKLALKDAIQEIKDSMLPDIIA
ncbi:YdcH family protein [Hyphococcus sp.]|uniref:YdcH family protein n=1 Tax=Hyphococcus sp. TaxID=2038636 RepID=UPI0035C70E46